MSLHSETYLLPLLCIGKPFQEDNCTRATNHCGHLVYQLYWLLNQCVLTSAESDCSGQKKVPALGLFWYCVKLIRPQLSKIESNCQTKGFSIVKYFTIFPLLSYLLQGRKVEINDQDFITFCKHDSSEIINVHEMLMDPDFCVFYCASVADTSIVDKDVDVSMH